MLRSKFVLAVWMVAMWGCEGNAPELSPEESIARIGANLVTTCVKDPAEIALAGLTPCVTDEDCAAEIVGTFCNEASATCDSMCDDTRPCETAGEACDCAGRCVPADSLPTPTPIEPPTLSLATGGLDLAVVSAPQPIDLTVVSSDPGFAPGVMPRPPLEIYFHVERPAGLPETENDAIQINCSGDPANQSQYTSSCGLTSWTFLAENGRYRTTGRLFVRRHPSVGPQGEDRAWDISVLSAHTSEPHQRVSVNLLSTEIVSQNGDYSGTLSFAPEPGTSQAALRKVGMPVTAHVLNGKVMLSAKNTTLPYPYIRLTSGGYDQEIFAGFPVSIDASEIAFVNDPRTPRLKGKLTISLPLPPIAPSSNNLKRTYSFDLVRTTDLSAKKCPCATGQFCDSFTQMCFDKKVPAPATAPHQPPALSVRHPDLVRWSAASKTQLVKAFDGLGAKLFSEWGGIYSGTRRKPAGTADLLFDVPGFDLLRDDSKDLGYKLCKAYFPGLASWDFQTGFTCKQGKRATDAQRSEDCPTGATFSVVEGDFGKCRMPNGNVVNPVSICASLYDANRSGKGHSWSAEDSVNCPDEPVADLNKLRRDYVPCFHGKIDVGGIFNETDILDPEFDYVVDGKDYSCRSMAKRAFGLKTRPTTGELDWFLAFCESVPEETKVTSTGKRGVVYLCPFADSLVGTYAVDPAAEHMQCMPGTTSGTTNIDSARQTGAALPVSGDAACGASSPTDVNLYHLRDKNPQGIPAETQASLFWSCVGDLERSETNPKWYDYFAARTCISPERFLLALDVKTSKVDTILQPGTDGGDAKLVRSLQQWLGVTSYVVNQGMQEMTLARVVSSSAPANLGVMTWKRLDGLTQKGLALLLDPHVQKMLYRYPSLSNIVGEANVPDFDRSVALPVSMLNAVTTAYSLVEAHTNDVRLDVYLTCMDDNSVVVTARDQAIEQVSALTRTLAAVEVVAVQLYGSAGSPSWNGAWTKAVDRLSSAREKALTAIEELRSCTNPLGIPEDYVPLFFGDAQGANMRYFASSDFLLGQARQLVSEAKIELEAMRTAWLAQRDARFQDEQNQDERDLRILEIERNAGGVIAELCGTTSSAASTLARFSSLGTDKLTQGNCYYKETPECQGSDRPVSCYRGVIGEAAAAVLSAGMDIDLASRNWADLQAKFDLRHKQCTRIQGELGENNSLINQHAVHMNNLRVARQTNEQGKLGFGVMKAAVMGYLSNGASLADDAHSLVWDRAIGKKTEAMERAVEEFNTEMSMRLNDQRVTACFDEVDALHVGIETAFHVIARREQDAKAALVRFENAQARLSYAVLDARDTVEREKGREYLSVSHHFWLPEKRDGYLRKFKAAQLVSYLALLALGHDMQQSIAGRDEIISARVPADLEAVVGNAAGGIGLLGATRQVGGQLPEQQKEVLSLTEILGYAPATADNATLEEAQRRLRAHLISSEAAMYDSVTGAYLGQGIRFNLGYFGLSQRCSERLWRVSASVQTSGPNSGTVDGYTKVILYKSRNFADQDCWTPGMRTGTTRDEVGKMVPLLANGTAKQMVKGELSSKMNLGRMQMKDAPAGDEFDGSSNELRLMGMYGDYVLLFPVESLVQLKLGMFDDVLFRLDFISIGDQQEPT